MAIGIKIECPKCHADRTLLDTAIGLPAYAEPCARAERRSSINPECAVPVRLVLCPRCHYVELYHDAGLEKPA